MKRESYLNNFARYERLDTRYNKKGSKDTMKANIHPSYEETTITCSCGEVIHTRSTRKNIRVEICSKCHPFFTGDKKFVDMAGRIERFEKKYKKSK